MTTYPATENLRHQRESTGASLRAVAGLAGIAPAVLSRAERGLAELTPEQAERVVRALWAFGGSPEPRPEQRWIDARAFAVSHGDGVAILGGYVLAWRIPAIDGGIAEAVDVGALWGGPVRVVVDGDDYPGTLTTDHRGAWLAIPFPGGVPHRVSALWFGGGVLAMMIRVHAEERGELPTGEPLRLIRSMTTDSIGIADCAGVSRGDWYAMLDPHRKAIASPEGGHDAHN